jgi:hypothetical protein
MWKYYSICTICGRRTPPCDNLIEHQAKKRDLGFLKVELTDLTETLCYNIRTLNFCPSCAKKSYTIEELRTIGNYKGWSY